MFLSEMTNQNLSTSAIARNYKIQPKALFSYLMSKSYLCKKGKSYKLTDNGLKLGGSYQKNKEYTAVVWKHDCLNELIVNKFTPHLKGSKYRYPDDFMAIKKEFGKNEGGDIWESLENNLHSYTQKTTELFA